MSKDDKKKKKSFVEKLSEVGTALGNSNMFKTAGQIANEKKKKKSSYSSN